MLGKIGEFFRRLFRRAPPQPGHFVSGRKFSWHGRLDMAPWLWPARDYLVYVPRGYGGWRRRPLVVLIHGCKQTPEAIATGTRITDLADQHGWLVLLPRQSDKANPWSCWNWFDHATVAGRGETAIVYSQVKSVRRAYRVHPRRIFVVGMSAGGTLAATLGVRHPDLFSGVFVHSSLAAGAASSARVVFDVMTDGADTDVEAIGTAARAAAPKGTARLPLLAIHGDEDEVVAPVNAYQAVRQYLALNGRTSIAGARTERPPPDSETVVVLPDGRHMKVGEYRDGRRVIARLLQVPKLGHAWGGGDASLPYNDASGPDATGLLGEFVEGRLRP